MGHREALRNGDEVDAVGGYRHCHHWRPGERKAIKQQLGKRARSGARLALRMAALRGFTGCPYAGPVATNQNLAL
jgi:hypothetical protein